MFKTFKWNYLTISFIFISVSAFAAQLNVENVLKGNIFPRDIVITAKPVLVDLQGMMARFKVVDIDGVGASSCYLNASLVPSENESDRYFSNLDSVSCMRGEHKIVRHAQGQINGLDAPFDGLKISCDGYFCEADSSFVSVVLADKIDFTLDHQD